MAKIRVYELARELGIESKVLVAKLQEMGEFVRSSSSRLDAPVARRLRAAFPSAQQSAPGPDVSPVAAPLPIDMVAGGPTSKPAQADRELPRSSESAAAPVERLPMDHSIDDRYVLLPNPIRGSAASTVRKAVDTTDGSFVAIKFVLHPQSDSLSRRLFEREMASLDRLNHPNIVRPIRRGIEDDSGSLFFILDWYEQSLADVLEDGRTFTWDEVLHEVALPLSQALSYAHLKGVEHRDIKPGNILIRADGAPVLADFGIAKLRDEPSTEETVRRFHSGVFTPLDIDDLTPWVRDVYSLGVVLLRCLSPGPLGTHADLPSALDAAPVPPDVRDFLAQCMSPHGPDRPANGSVMYEMLASIASRAHVRAQARDHYAWLRLTKTARDALNAFDTQTPARAPEMIAQEDLAGDSYAEFVRSAETGLPNRDKIDVVGTRYRFSLAVDADSNALVVTHVAEPRVEELERRRSRSLALGRSFTWYCQKPMRDEQAANGRSTLIERLDLFYEAADDARAARDSEAAEVAMFDQWSRLLDAREELERGHRAPLDFTLDSQRGRDATLLLTSEPDEDLVGQQLDIKSADDRWRGTGEVVDQDGTRVKLRSTRNFRTLPRQGRLQVALGPTKIALQRQRDAINAVREGTALRPSLRDLLLAPETARPPESVDVADWHRELDGDKQEAVRKALGTQDFLVVQGPPGTGKTSFIVETVWQNLKANPDARILLVSQTHVAVDNALERLDKAGVTNLVRLGRIDDGNVAQTTQHLTLDRQMSQWADRMRTRAVSHLEAYATARGLDPRHLNAAQKLEALAAVLRQSEAIDAHLARSEDNPPSELATALGTAQDAGSLQERLDRNSERQNDLLVEIASILDGDLTIDLSTTAAEARYAVEALLGDGDEVRHVLDLMALQADWLQRVGSQDEMAFAFMKTRHVIAGTNLGFLGHPAARDLEFDLCILDEASKATATETLVPLARSHRWVLVGDTNQLPPMDEEVLRHPHLMDAYDLDEQAVKATLFQRLADYLPNDSQKTLGIQYRMIRPIGDLISTVFYKGELRSPRTDTVPGYETLGKSVLWLDTAGMGPNRHEASSSGSDRSYVNRTEVRLALDRLKILERAISTGVVQWPERRKPLVLLIAPYRAQVEELRRQLARVSVSQIQPEVLSVDSVQGRESDFAIFSVTRSNPRGSIGFLGEPYWRRVNVALSRAQFGLTIIGDRAFCAALPGGLRDVVDYIASNPDSCEIREAAR